MPKKKLTKEAYAEAKWFAALGTAVRLAILRALVGGEKSVSELNAALLAGEPSIRPAVKTLERAGLIYTQVVGNNRRCKLVNAVVGEGVIELTSPTGARVVLPL